MSAFQVKVKATVVGFKPKTITGIVIDRRNKLTLIQAGVKGANWVYENMSDKYPTICVDVIKVTKLKEDFITNTDLLQANNQKSTI